MPASEAALTKSMMKRIKKRGGYARKTTGSRFSSGMLDITAVYRGHAVHIEVKLPGRENTLSTLQRATMQQIAAAGGVARMYVSTVQVDRLLDAIDRLYERRSR